MIHLSSSAIAEVLRLKAKQKDPTVQLRLGVRAGGCAGNLYTLQFDSTIADHDRTFDSGEITIIVSENSLTYIDSLTLDYSEDLMGGGFRFHNPQAVNSCSCGNSFSIN